MFWTSNIIYNPARELKYYWIIFCDRMTYFSQNASLILMLIAVQHLNLAFITEPSKQLDTVAAIQVYYKQITHYLC